MRQQNEPNTTGRSRQGGRHHRKSTSKLLYSAAECQESVSESTASGALRSVIDLDPQD